MKIKLCNVHKLAVANEGEERKPIFIPFGTWPYDDTISQTLDKPHAEGIAADLDKQIAAGEPGIPVYQGHPDVPEYAGKYPDKGAMGWVKKILVNEDGMECQIEWDRDPGKGFGWFSPYWIGDKPVVGPDGKKNVIVDGLTSIGLVNNPNIREFRLANEAQLEERKPMKTYELPEHIAALAKKFDERRAMANVVDANGMGHGDDGKFDGSGAGGGGAGGASEETKGKLQKMLKHEAVSVAAGGNPATAGKDAIHFEYRGKKYYVGKDNAHMVKQFEDAGLVKRISGTGGGGASAAKRDDYAEILIKRTSAEGKSIVTGKHSPSQINKALGMLRDSHSARKSGFTGVGGSDKGDAADRKSIHAAAIRMGFKYNRATHQYE